MLLSASVAQGLLKILALPTLKDLVRNCPDEITGHIYYFVLNKGKMLPNWKKPHIKLNLTSSEYILFMFSGTSRSKVGVNDIM